MAGAFAGSGGGSAAQTPRNPTAVRAKSPTKIEDDLCCHVRVAWFGRSSFAFEYLLRDERSGRNVAEGRTVQVMYDYAVRRSRLLDPDLKAAIEQFEGRSVPSRS